MSKDVTPSPRPGIPAVFGARGAMQILARDEQVEVDGRTGRVVRFVK